MLTARLAPTRAAPERPQFAFAGIAKPWRMERALKAAGCRLADFVALPDHLAFDEGLLRALARRAEAVGADLLTTEKDYARLPPAWRARVGVWPVQARFEDEAALDALLDDALGA